MDGTWTLALRIVSPEPCQLATEVIKMGKLAMWATGGSRNCVKFSVGQGTSWEYMILKISIPFNDLCGKLARLWTHNPECQGSSPIQVGNLTSNSLGYCTYTVDKTIFKILHSVKLLKKRDNYKFLLEPIDSNLKVLILF